MGKMVGEALTRFAGSVTLGGQPGQNLADLGEQTDNAVTWTVNVGDDFSHASSYFFHPDFLTRSMSIG